MTQIQTLDMTQTQTLMLKQTWTQTEMGSESDLKDLCHSRAIIGSFFPLTQYKILPVNIKRHPIGGKNPTTN